MFPKVTGSRDRSRRRIATTNLIITFRLAAAKASYPPRQEPPLRRGCITNTLLIPDLISQSETPCFVQPLIKVLSPPHLLATEYHDEEEKENPQPDATDRGLR